MEQLITEFYFRSLTTNWKDFDWDDAFELFKPGLQNKLDEHGQGEFEDFRNMQEGFTGNFAHIVPDEFCIYGDYVQFTTEDVADIINKAHFEKFRSTFKNTFSDLKEMLHKMDTILTLEERIELFDSVIHAQHVTGNIFEDLDTEYLKEEAETMFEEVV